MIVAQANEIIVSDPKTTRTGNDAQSRKAQKNYSGNTRKSMASHPVHAGSAAALTSIDTALT